MDQYQYISFISYRHQPLADLVSARLRKGLETFHLPKDAPLPKRRRVFRDTDELPTSADLGTDIENALENSGWLICLCTEDYPKSRWCMREVEAYLELGRKDRILPVLVSGDPELSVPEMIRDLPIAADVRSDGPKERNKKIRRAMPVLLDRMTGIKAERLAAGERKFRFGISAGTVAAVTMALLGFAFYATGAAERIRQNNIEIEKATEESEAATEEAITQRNEALLKNAQYLAQKAWDAVAQGDDETAIRLALSALPKDLHGEEPVSEEAVGALRVALSMPAKPKNLYRFERSIQTDFEITGYFVISSFDDRIFLTGRDFGVSEHYMIYDTGELGEQEFRMRQKAPEEGYSKGYNAQSGSPNHEVYFGPEKQMRIIGNSGSEGWTRDITLNEEPFYADHVQEKGFSYSMLAWLEDPPEGKTAQTAVLNMTRSAAVGPLDITGSPICASFSENCKRVAVIDESGALKIFDTETGEQKSVLPGPFSWVNYPYASSVFCAIDTDGKAFLFDAVTLEEKYAFESTSPVKSILFCPVKETFLACCTDGVRIYSRDDGKLLYTLSTDEEPLFAIWSGYEEALYYHKGNSFVVGFPDRIDTYLLDTDVDTSQSDYIPLYREGMDGIVSNAFYSPDGKSIYVGCTNRSLTKWEAATGKLIWYNPDSGKADSGVSGGASLSLDGTALWRSDYSGSGIEKVDAETGETIYTASFGKRVGFPVESPDGNLAAVRSDYGGIQIVFDAKTGEELWRAERYGDLAFSEDSSELYCIQESKDADNKKEQMAFVRLDAGTGRELERHILAELTGQAAEDGFLFSCLSPDGKSVLVSQQTFTFTQNPSEMTVRVFRLPEGECTAFGEASGFLLNSSFSYSGIPVMRWTDEEELDLCRALHSDGSPGEIVEADSAEGRQLTATADTLGMFAGDPVLIGSTRECTLTRMSDGVKLFSIGDQEAFYSIALAPDGSSACLWSSNRTPFVILASDADTVVEKAIKRIGEDIR